MYVNMQNMCQFPGSPKVRKNITKSPLRGYYPIFKLSIWHLYLSNKTGGCLCRENIVNYSQF